MDSLNPTDEAVKYGGAFGKLCGAEGKTIAPKLLWFISKVHGELIAIATFPRDTVVAEGEYQIALDDGRKLRAAFNEEFAEPNTGARKLTFVVLSPFN